MVQQIAEAQVSLGNLLTDDEKEQESLYEQAIVRLEKAQDLGVGDYSEMISELKGEHDGDDDDDDDEQDLNDSEVEAAFLEYDSEDEVVDLDDEDGVPDFDSEDED